MRKRTMLASAAALALGIFGFKYNSDSIPVETKVHESSKIAANSYVQQQKSKEQIKKEDVLREKLFIFKTEFDKKVKLLELWKQNLAKGRKEIHDTLIGPALELKQLINENAKEIDPQDATAADALIAAIESLKVTDTTTNVPQISLPDMSELTSEDLTKELDWIDEKMKDMNYNFHRDTIGLQNEYYDKNVKFRDNAKEIIDALKEVKINEKSRERLLKILETLEYQLNSQTNEDSIAM